MRKMILSVMGLILLSVFSSVICLAQNRKISGTVTDENGNALAGATVTVKNSQVSAVTNTIGYFELSAPANTRTLVITHVTMQRKEVGVGASGTVTISMEPVVNTLSDVVVIGYGNAKRANLTSSQTSVSAKDINRTVNTTLEQALQGRAAGVYITQNSGQPGGAMSVTIRGISSLNRTQPLYVIDGVQMQSGEDVSFGSTSTSNPLAGLNPADIEDVQILQGPSATAIYGSRATNGVILITTKRGKAGIVKVNYIYQYNLQTPPDHLEVMNLSQYAQMVKEYHQIAGGTTPGEFLDPSILGKGTDWQDALFNNAAMNKHQLSLSGGSNNTTYYASGEYLDQEGVAAGSGFRRYSVRMNLDNKPREWATIGFNLNYNQTKEELAATNYGDAASPLIANALRLTPQIPVTNFDGSWGGSDPVNGANQFAPINPIALADLITNESLRRQFQGGVNLAVTPIKGLTLRTSYNATLGNGVSTYYTPTYNIDQWHYNLNASLQNGSYHSSYWNWNQLVEYTRQIEKHNFTVMASHESQESLWKALSVGRTGFLTNDIYDVNAGDPLSATNGGGTYDWSQESYLGRLSYNYDNRYLLVGTFRRDGSPYFGSAIRWGNFPSVSAAWRLSQEKFFSVPFISELKLRYETGLTGNQGTGSGIYAPMIADATRWGTGFLPGSFTNDELQWEETKTNNFGINIGLLKNKITIEADYYIRKTSNMIMVANLPWYMGTNNSPGSITAPLVNSGDMKTNGWNFTVNTTIISNKDFKWESNLNLSHFKSEVIRLTGDRPFISRSSWWFFNPLTWTQRAEIGHQPWLFRGYIEEGLFQSVDEINKSAIPVDNNGNRRPVDPNNGIWVGDVKYKDINGDGKIDVNDETYIGNPWPKLAGGFTNNFSYKGFDLSVLVTATFGNDIYNAIAAQNSNPNNVNLSRNFFLEAMNYAKLTTKNGQVVLSNPETRIPRISNNQVSSDNNYGKITNRFVEDGSYIRLKNVSLSYNVPDKYLNYTKVIKGLRVTVSAQNVFTITDYKGYDPEVGAYVGMGSSGQNQAIGIDFGRYPLTRFYTATLNVNF